MTKEKQGLLKPLKEYGEPLDSILKDLCEAVNADYYTMDFSQNDWYLSHTWSLADQKKFEEKLYTKVKKNPKLYSSLLHVSSSKKIKNSIQMFLFTYGWKYQNNENEN
jgi:hypothetical protein